ncbi:hypothetical protein AN958_11340 [Leucoagaricus sp. SymC.cos]|nr:hypothetical protein AN958_11340 [Leucoagaricus sp. SymC.cos]
MSLADSSPTIDSAPQYADSVDAFKATSLELFEKLTQDHYMNMPHADRIASKARLLLTELFVTFCTVRSAARSSRNRIQKTLTIEIKVSNEEDEVIAQAKKERIVQKIEKAAKDLEDKGMFPKIARKLDDFMNTVVQYELGKVTEKIKQSEQAKGQLTSRKALVENAVNPPSAGGEMGSLINFIFGTLFNFAKYKQVQACQEGSQEIQQHIDNMKADMLAIEGINEKTQGARDLIIDIRGKWQEVYEEIYAKLDLSRITDILSAKSITLEMKEEITELLKAKYNTVDDFSSRVDDIIKELNDRYGRTMTQVVQAFRKAIGDVSKTLTQLTTAAEIIHEHQVDTLLAYIRQLARCFLKQFCIIAGVVSEWSSYLKNCSGTTSPFLSNGFINRISKITLATEDFGEAFHIYRERITVLVTNEVVDKKSRAALSNRKAVETHGSKLGNYLPLATLDQVEEVLGDLKTAFSKTLQFSLEFGMGYLHYKSQPGVSPTSLDDDVDINEFPVNPFLVDPQIVADTSNVLGQQISGVSILAGEQNTAELEIVISIS